MKVEVQDIDGEAVTTPEPQEADGSQRGTGRPKPTFWRTMLSVMQASFGVQSDANRQRDFEDGSISGFVAAALIFTVVFVLTLVVIVSLVLP